ncbi:MAG: hypothetical protein SAK29_03040 [Scytonema sp. PMC 1069.18]|nr:hypothetical protein [Scytonema sp. PMC 1069.18]MEC4886027.1 hypothetical protein [Scytonema sp. PMC 1070.18]
MTNVKNLTQTQLRQMGLEALAQALGLAGMLRFTQQFDNGSGDYTRDRDKILGNSTLESIFAEIREQRQLEAESLDTLPKFTSSKMIDVSKLSKSQIRQMGIEALTKALGSAGMLKFMQQFEMGSRDYTQNPDKISLDDLPTSIEEEQKHQNS